MSDDLRDASDQLHEAMVTLRTQMNRTLDGMIDARAKLVDAMEGFGRTVDTVNRRLQGPGDIHRDPIVMPPGTITHVAETDEADQGK